MREDREVYVRIAMMSHLNDAACEIHTNPEMAQIRMEFVRALVFYYPNSEVLVSEKRLNQIWESVATKEIYS